MEAVLRGARADEVAALSALALRSKAHWGYSAEFLDAVRDELTLSDVTGVVVADVDGGALAGFVRLTVDGDAGELEMLFVDPPFIGAGIGGRLLEHALAAARAGGARRLGLDADPDAEGFYARYGARVVGRSPSASIPGRMLPRMEFEI